MRIDTKFLRSRVSTRIAMLFLIAALLPTTLLAVLTYGNINRLLHDQQQTELVETSRSYALAIFGRLVFANSAIKNIARGSSASNPIPYSYLPIFESVEPLRPKKGASSLSEAPMLTMQSAKRPTEHSAIFISQPTSIERNEFIKGRLVPSYLWGERDEVSAAYNICVFDKSIRLYCDYPEEISSDRSQLQGKWTLFLKPEFRAESWTIVATRRFPVSRDPLVDFLSVYILVAILSVLLIMLLSLIEIRRTMVPLEKLMDGAKRIATGDFRKIVIKTDDEFGELTSAVNLMSGRIEQQLATLQSLSAIDSEMRERIDLPRLIFMAATAMRRVVPCANLYVARHPTSESDTGYLFVQEYDNADVIESAVNFSNAETAWLAQQTSGILDRPPRTFPQLDNDQKSWSFALQWQGYACGMLTLIWRGKILSEKEIVELIEIVNRIAAAIQMQDREQRLIHQAIFDSLTGLLNRHGLEERITQIMVKDTPSSVLFVDIDGFKQINDNFGHKTGDLLLQAIADRIVTSKVGIAGRLGGDEFVLLLLDDGCPETVAGTARSLMDTLSKPFTISSQQFLITCSIGIAVHPVIASDGLTLIERADIAMYRAKQGGRDGYRFYSESMSVENYLRLEIEADLRLALKRNELVLHYQPKVSLKTKEIIGAEALVRWAHPTRGLISPIHFISVAEETGLIIPIGAWVIRHACAQNAAWRSDGLAPIRVAVNVSARQFIEPNFVSNVASILIETGLPAEALEIEITESLIMNDVDQAISIMNGLRELGVTLSIDDFGTGYSSLAYLKRFPISVLKIDQSFVRDIADRNDNCLIISSIIGLAHNLHLQVVAEGVETEGQLHYLNQQGCDEIQGYFFSRPVGAKSFALMLTEGKRLNISEA